MCIVHITGDIASCKLCGLNTKCNIVHRYILAVQNCLAIIDLIQCAV